MELLQSKNIQRKGRKQMNISDIKELIREVSNYEIYEFQYEDDGGMLSLVKGKRGTVVKEYIKEDIVVPQAEEKVFIEETDMNVKTVTSPLVGTVYMAPAEGEEPFVSVGDVVKKGQVLAIVEAMKLMNEIESEYTGKIAEILVEDGSAVEYGTPLFRLEQ